MIIDILFIEYLCVKWLEYHINTNNDVASFGQTVVIFTMINIPALYYVSYLNERAKINCNN